MARQISAKVYAEYEMLVELGHMVMIRALNQRRLSIYFAVNWRDGMDD